MQKLLNLDTHILLFALLGRLRVKERALLEESRWSVSGVVLWEIAKLAELGRITLNPRSSAFRHALAGVHIWPVDLEVAITSTELDIKSDPADELIAATSVVHEVPLLTRDKRLLTSRIVPLA